jgi:protein-tyrosine phosphatase
MAQGILEDKLNKKNLNWFIDSAGTSGWHDGERPDQRAIMTCLNYGIDIRKQNSRKFSLTDFDTFDYIFVMDKSNYENVMKLTTNTSHLSKVHLLLDFVASSELQGEVPDPYHTNGFETVFNILDKSLESVVEKIKSNSLATSY